VHPTYRSPETLKSKWLSLKKSFTISWANWNTSGQNDPTNFTYCWGRADLLYMFHVFRSSPSLEFAIRTVPDEAQREEGVPGTAVRDGRETTAAAPARRRRIADSTPMPVPLALQVAPPSPQETALLQARQGEAIATTNLRNEETQRVRISNLSSLISVRNALSPEDPAWAAIDALVAQAIDDLHGHQGLLGGAGSARFQ
jgi:hypothetical protein